MIYHVLPGGDEHHYKNLLAQFVDGAEELGVDPVDQTVVYCWAGGVDVDRIASEWSPSGGSMTIKSTIDLFSLVLKVRRSDLLVLHSAFMPMLWLVLAACPWVWRRTVWVMWGGDINGLVRRAQTNGWKNLINVSFAKRAIPGLGAVCALAPGDYGLVEGFCSRQCTNYRRAFYSQHQSVDAASVFASQRSQLGSASRVLLGNSGAQSNNHIEALEWLSQYRENEIEVVCPLGYGLKPEYGQQVLQAGRDLLGDRFVPLTGMMAHDAYNALLDTVDVLVFNHTRQQGLYNVYYLLKQGRKLFVRGDCASSSMLREFGITVFDSRDIPGMSFEKFARPLAENTIVRNLDGFHAYLSRDAAMQSWRALYADFGV